jgi:hypothetical protein
MQTAAQIIAEAKAAGIDVEAIEHNLTLTPDERWRQHDAALALVLALRAAGQAKYGDITEDS